MDAGRAREGDRHLCLGALDEGAKRGAEAAVAHLRVVDDEAITVHRDAEWCARGDAGFDAGVRRIVGEDIEAAADERHLQFVDVLNVERLGARDEPLFDGHAVRLSVGCSARGSGIRAALTIYRELCVGKGCHIPRADNLL